jgi:hypothetical protein
MVESVTGSGKTHVGMGALAKLYAENKRLSTLVVVPSIVLLRCERCPTIGYSVQRGAGASYPSGFTNDENTYSA